MPELIDVVVETPRGSRKYEHYPQQGVMRLDRRLPGSFAFPADYGYVPNTVGSDGEPLDALVLTVEATYPGIRVAARPIGVFWISTGERREAKLVTSGGPAGNTRSSGGPPAIAGHQQVAAPLARTPSPRTRWARQHCGLYQPLVEGPSRQDFSGDCSKPRSRGRKASHWEARNASAGSAAAPKAPVTLRCPR